MADSIRATPQNPYTGALARGLRSLQQLASQYEVDKRVPLLGGTGVDELLSLPGAASLAEDVSYYGPRALIRGGNAATGGIGTFKLDPRVADAADVAGMAAPLSSLARRVGTNLVQTAPYVARDIAQSTAAPLRSYVVKPKGGNWLAGSVEKPVEMLKQAYVPDYERWGEGAAGVTDRAKAEAAALNKWLDTKLSKYIRNEMGTPEDPLRALAERGIIHAEVAPVDTYGVAHLGQRRTAMGFPAEGMGQSEQARAWEAAADDLIHNLPAGERINVNTFGEDAAVKALKENPWLTKVPPETQTYGVYSNILEGQTQFGHLIDELRFSMDPSSGLPAHLRFDPKDIDKITVPQAVERVSKINAWRAAEASRAEREGLLANLNAAPRVADDSLQLSFVDKPGGKWVDIPDTVDDRGMQVCNSIGKAGGWCTQSRWAAETYGSGPNRLTALVDAEGRPHAQAKLTSDADEGGALESVFNMMTPEQEDAYMQFADSLGSPMEHGQAIEFMREKFPDLFRDYQDILKSQASGPPDISELKPVGNSFSSERAQEYMKRDPQYKEKVTQSVLKFLNGGEWGAVHDLHHYDIVDLQRDPTMLTAYLRDITGQDSRAAQAIFNSAVEAAPEAPRFMTTRQLREFLTPKTEGYAAGGLVQNGSSGPIPYDSAKIDAIVNSLREDN